MRRLLTIIVVLIGLTGCAGGYQAAIEQWQYNIVQEGWSHAQVEKPINEYPNLTTIAPVSNIVLDAYRHQIKCWQDQIREAGWSEDIVKNITGTTLAMSSYECSSHAWQSPNAFLYNAMYGDCLEIAAQILATFVFLEFPYGCRCRVVRPVYQPWNHAVFRYEWPEGVWHQVETTPSLTTWFEKYFYVKVIDFDAKGVY